MAKKQTAEEQALAQFDWEDSPENTFFGQQAVEEEDEVEDVVDKVTDDEEEEDDSKKPASKETKKPKAKEGDDADEDEEDEDDDSKKFEFGAGGEGDDEEDDEGGSSDMTDEQFKTVAAYQLERFEFVEIDENEEITPERLDELWEEEKKLARKDEVEKLKALGDEVFQRQIEYMNNGGTAADFINQLKEVNAIPEFDIKEDDGQKAAIRYYMRNIEQNDDKEIDEFFEYLEESGKTEAYAKRYNKKIEALKKEKDKAIEENQRKQQELREKDKEQFVDDLNSTLEDEEAVGFKIPKEIAEKMGDYFSEPTVKMNGGKRVTGFQADLTKLFADKKNLAKLGFLMLNNWDTSIFEKKAASKATRKIKTNLSTKGKKPASQSTTRKRSLSDFFSE